ncbi:FAD-linked oxidoreductase, partial [Acaromyces ingoldii]
PLATVPLSTLLRSYFVYTCCSFPSLIDAGPALIEWCRDTKIPGVWSLTEWVVRRTFFAQFVGAETAQGCIPLLSSLSRSNLGAILNFSAEVSNEDVKKSSANESPLFDELVDEVINAIDVAAHVSQLPADYGATTDEERAALKARPNRDGSMMVAVKLSGLLRDASILERASSAIVSREHFSSPPHPFPPVSVNGKVGPCAGLAIPIAALDRTDVEGLRALWAAMQKIASHARQLGGVVTLLVDAEYSWYQPAIDAFFESIAAEYNKLSSPTASQGPLIYNTFQAYLRRTPSHLQASLERAKSGGYSLGVKLVRGAYVDYENQQWRKRVVDPPPSLAAAREGHVWSSKTLTDQCFDGCARRLVDEIHLDLLHTRRPPSLGVIFASHNTESAQAVIEQMASSGLAQPPLPAGDYPLALAPHVRGRLFFAQLYGMSDQLTRTLQSTFDPLSGGPGPHLVQKYVPYGSLKLVMPYLIRRAQENKSVMGGGKARAERKELAREIRSRFSL